VTVSRGDRIGGGIGVITWTFAAVVTALTPLTLGWKLLFELLYIACGLDFLLLFLGRPTLSDAIRSFLRGHRSTRE
jgi:hypothetical protein